MPDRTAGNDCFGSSDDPGSIDAEVPVEIGDRAGLTEMLDSQRAGAVAMDRSQPGERCRMPVDDRHEPALRRNIGKEALDVAIGVNESVLAPNARSRPCGQRPCNWPAGCSC